MRRPGESCRTRTVGRQDETAERGSKMDSRTERQDGAQNKAAEQGGRTERQDGAAGRGGRTERQNIKLTNLYLMELQKIELCMNLMSAFPCA